jgi:phosphoglycolate phosphatase-like HAD superfamily hydrolase
MSATEYMNAHQAFVFELDDVLYPVKDFHLQVYYLFASFMEYTEQLDASSIVQFMKDTYEQHGEKEVLERTFTAFGIADKYRDNYALLNKTAKLPLKLLMFEPVLKFMQDLVVERKTIYLLVAGDPEQQLNKIRQIEWNGLEQYIRVFFKEEITLNPDHDSLSKFMAAHQLSPADVLVVANAVPDQQMAAEQGIKFLTVDKLLLS